MMSTPNASPSGTFLIGGDVPVRRLGYGTMRLVGEGAWGEPEDPEEAKRVLRRAVELGVTLIDTADAYGPEIAERLIAEALHPYPAGLVIATKGGITRQGPAKTEYVGRAGYLIQCVEMSLRRLKLERIDLYQLHRIDPRTPLEESLVALKRMHEQGKIAHVGLSEVTPVEIEEAEKIVPVVTVRNRLFAVVPDGGRQADEAGSPGAEGARGDGGAAFRLDCAAFDCMAAPPLAGDAADSGDLEGCAS